MKTIIPTPTVGRIVLYVLDEADVALITKRRINARPLVIDDGFQTHDGNPVEAGEIYPMVIVRTWGDKPTSPINGQVLLDGGDSLWKTSRDHNAEKLPGTFHWPVYPVQLEARICGSAGEALPLAESPQS